MNYSSGICLGMSLCVRVEGGRGHYYYSYLGCPHNAKCISLQLILSFNCAAQSMIQLVLQPIPNNEAELSHVCTIV